MALLYSSGSIPTARESPSDLDNPLRVVSTWIAMLACSCTYLITHGPDEYIAFWVFAVIHPYTCNVMGWPRGEKLMFLSDAAKKNPRGLGQYRGGLGLSGGDAW
jgi:hypothetical protein